MNDNQIMIALIVEIENQMNLVGVPDFEVSRKAQPTNQYTGASTNDPIKTRVFLYAITNPVSGKSRSYFIDGVDPKRADIQHKSKLIQVSVLHSFDESDVNASTPEDMANLVRDLIDSPDCIKNLRDDGVFLQDAGDVRPVFTVNDTDRNESTPNFDIVLNYASDIVKESEIIDTVAPVVVGV